MIHDSKSRSEFNNGVIEGSRLLLKPHIVLSAYGRTFVFFGRSFENKDSWKITERFVRKLNRARAKS